MERDDGNLFVLEATMISLILLGAAYAVQGLQDSSVAEQRPRAELSRLVDDALAVLAGLDAGNGTLLDLYLAEAIHCATDATPWPEDCDETRGENLSVKLESYMPLGTGYAIGIGNGGAVHEIYRSPMPRGEAVSSSITFSPNWTLGYVYTRLSCYPDLDTVHADARVLPISRGAPVSVTYANVTIGSAEITATAANASADWNDTRAWNLTIPGNVLPASGTLLANVTGNGTFRGGTAYTSCAHSVDTALLHATVNATRFGTSTQAMNVSIGSSMTFSADLSALDALGDVSVTGANVTLYQPIPSRAGGADHWVQAELLPLTGALSARTATWTPPPDSLYGAHVALLRVGLDVGGVQVEARRAVLVYVGLSVEGSGTVLVPQDPPYRVTLQAWLPDWG